MNDSRSVSKMTPLLCLLMVGLQTTTASAQMKSAPAAPAAPVVAPADSPSAVKELAAQAAAEKWLGLIDAGDYGKAWDQCAQLFRDRVTREQWSGSLPTTRGSFGAVKGRKAEAAAFKTSLPGAPDGQYVTVLFRTTFEKKESAEELVTLAFEDNAWRPTGYFIK